MIKNERQYKITKAQAQKLDRAAQELIASKEENEIHPLLKKAEIDALQSQLSDLKEELLEYESLKGGHRSTAVVDSFDQLPRALIEGRIAAGLSQENLAAKMGLKPQQVQRYEATDYKSASLSRLAEVVRTLGIKVQADFLSPVSEFPLSAVIKRLKEVGLDREFIVRRLLPKPPGLFAGAEEAEGDGAIVEAAESLHRIFGWSPAAIFGSEPLLVSTAASTTARFKLPGHVKENRLAAYTVYAHYLALLVLEATRHIPAKPIPPNAAKVRQAVIAQYGEVTFETVLRYVWTLGIPVLPLNDPGSFHGACWRVNGRNVIVLKQHTASPARWLHDLLHELWHAAHEPNLEEHPVIEESELSPTRRQSSEEKASSRFAGDVVLAGKAEELAEKCVKAASGRVENLKAVLPKVATRENVPIDALANYMAFRLSFQGINWWGAASNLQQLSEPISLTPRDLLLKHVRLTKLNDIDRNLLLRALEPLVLGFSGKIGSGKSTVSEGVAKALGWNRASFGDYVRTIARSRGLEESTEVLQELGAKLVSKDVEKFCYGVLVQSNWQSGEPLVIDGLRHAKVLATLRRLVAPLNLRLIFLEVDDRIRHERLRNEDESILDTLENVERHSTEREVKSILPEMADLKVSGDRPVKEVVREIVNWVHQGDGVNKSCLR